MGQKIAILKKGFHGMDGKTWLTNGFERPRVIWVKKKKNLERR